MESMRFRIYRALRLLFVCYVLGLLYIFAKIPSENKAKLLTDNLIENIDSTYVFPAAAPYQKQDVWVETENTRNCENRKNNKIKGPGEDGKIVTVPININMSKIKDYHSKNHGFNLFVSDLIGVHRSLGDCRPQACRDKIYPPDLPPASVVIIFREEYPSIVLRTAYSVLDTTPPHLLKDVVLVDDGSVDEHLTTIVDIHVANVDKFHLVRNEKPLGLMMARQRGIEASLADYFVVMDSHMEVCEGWMEPIIYRLVNQPKTLITPQVGGIHHETFQLEIGETFDQSFMYLSQITMGQTWVSHTEEFVRMRNKSIEPLDFPVIQGMVMAMKKDYFFQLGGFDPGMRVWGTEQMELSVKVWLCGGRVELIPCSRVAHMFRITQWGGTINKTNHIANNRHRFVSVWLEGEHKDIVLDLQVKKDGKPSNVTERMAMKVANKCKPYQYFLDQIKQFSDIYEVKNTLAYGTIYNNYTNICWDNIVEENNEPGQIGRYPCHASDNQYFLWTEKCQIRFEQHMIYVKPNSTDLLTRKTILESNDQSTVFSYKYDNTIVHEESKLCVTVGPKFLQLKPCVGSAEQIWVWKRLRDAKCKPL